MNEEYHMYDATSPKFQYKEINIPDNKIIDDNVLPPPTRKLVVTFKPISKKSVIIEHPFGDDEII